MAPDVFDASKDLPQPINNTPRDAPGDAPRDVSRDIPSNTPQPRGHFQGGRRIGAGAQTESNDSSQEHHRSRKRHPDDYSEVMAAERATTNGFAAFAPKPKGITFESQHPGETILLFLRQHPIVNVPWMLIALLMLLAPMLFILIIPFAREIPLRFQFIMVLGWYLLTMGYVFEQVLMWLFNSFVITDERIIDIDFYSLIYKQMDYAKLDKIQDISSRTGGVVYSLLDVGNIFVQTASEVPEFVFENISHPSKVTKLLNELVIEEEREQIEGRVS